ncbi:MAG: excinuclease ABC subunit UvrA, partial [SAR324 cluster bacterium]|nr:excinuclease ABC subunit UvrA [SAR324 cluster bacterium]
EGFLRAYVKNKLVRLDEWEEQEPKLKKKTPIDLVIDRIEVSESEQKRLAEAIENAFQKGHGLLKLKRAGIDTDFEFLSETPACVETDFFQEEALTPRMFSFNSHVGACPACDGLGEHAYRISNPTCPECHGERLKPEYRAVTIQGRNISQFCNLNILEAQKELESWVLTPNQLTVAEQALREIQTRLDFLVNVGLDYLNLDQKASTLSGGEAQRIRLASQIGSGLVGVMYVLDEPTIGLHPRDTDRLIKTLKRLRDLGNTVILVEHDLETIRAADHIIDIGPGAGHYGGLVTASGSPAQISSRKNTLTGRYLKGEKVIPVPEQRRKALPDHELVVLGASANNLKGVDVRFPLGLMNVVTGVSGSGKSSLLVDVLQRALEKKMLDKRVEVGKHREIKGYEKLEQLM